MPRGILKKNWMEKHMRILPAVVVLFMDLDWKHPSWNEKKMECASKVESVRYWEGIVQEVVKFLMCIRLGTALKAEAPGSQ